MKYFGLLLVMALVPGCASTPCGPGTTEAGGECTFVPAVACGEGTRLINGKCVPAAGSISCGFGTVDDNNVCNVAIPLLPITAGRAIGISELTMPTGPGGLLVAIQGGLQDGSTNFGLTIHTAGPEGNGRQVLFGGAAENAGLPGLTRFSQGQVFAMEVVPGIEGEPLTAGPGLVRMPIAGAPEALVLTDATISSIVVDPGSGAAVTLATVTGTITYEQAQTVVSPTIGPLGDYLRQNGYDGTDDNSDNMDDRWTFSASFNFSPEVVL
jgi:hypothetical protein